MKLPIQLTKEDLPDVMYIPIRIEVGPANKNEINETLEGKIIECSLAANPPNLPGIATFQTIEGKIRRFSFFEIKSILKI